jgi:Sec-independent protein translocase protein TatA
MLDLLTHVLHEATAGDGHAVCTVAIAVFSLGFLIWQLTLGKWEPVVGFVVFAAIMVGHCGGLSAPPSNIASHMPYVLLVSVVAAAVVAAPLKAPSATGNEGFAVGIEGFTEHGDNDDDGAHTKSTEKNDKKHEKQKKKKKMKKKESDGNEDEDSENHDGDSGTDGEHHDDHDDHDDHGGHDGDSKNGGDQDMDANVNHDHGDNDYGDNDHGDNDHGDNDHGDNDTGNKEPFTDSADDDTEPFKVDEFKSFLDTYKNVTPSQLKHMTDDTKNLLETQKTLIDTIKTMSPVLKEGKQVLDTFKDYFSLDDKKAMEQMFKSYKDK